MTCEPGEQCLTFIRAVERYWDLNPMFKFWEWWGPVYFREVGNMFLVLSIHTKHQQCIPHNQGCSPHFLFLDTTLDL